MSKLPTFYHKTTEAVSRVGSESQTEILRATAVRGSESQLDFFCRLSEIVDRQIDQFYSD